MTTKRENLDWKNRRFHLASLFSIIFVIAMVSGVSMDASNPPPKGSFQLPTMLAGLKAEGEMATYSPSTIFKYLNGGSEVYLAYNLRSCSARRYTGQGGPFTVDVFTMGSSADAFGVFTHDIDGESVPIGQGALIRPSWLSFWKDALFISITSEGEGAAAEQALRAVAKAVDTLITREGKMPDLLKALPAAGLLPRKVRFLHDHAMLASYLDLGEGNPLLLSKSTDVVLARYERNGAAATLLLVRYGNENEATEAAISGRELMPDPKSGNMQTLGNGRWRSLKNSSRYLVLIAESATQELARELSQDTLHATAQLGKKSTTKP